MRPFLLLATRADDTVADDEYDAFRRLGGFGEGELRRVRLERAPLAEAGVGDLRDYAGILIGGSPFTSSVPQEAKSPIQRRVEDDLARVLDDVMEHDLPLLGACYGVGTLGRHQGAVVDGTYAEPTSAVTITLTEAGASDPLCADLPPSFTAFVGHKEAVRVLPEHAVLLAGSAGCPVQMFRIGAHQYATQFHPELDAQGLCTRIDAYRDHGYFDPAQGEALKAQSQIVDVSQAPVVLHAFARRYRG